MKVKLVKNDTAYERFLSSLFAFSTSARRVMIAKIVPITTHNPYNSISIG